MVRGFSRACLPDASLHIFGDGDDAESVASAARESGDMVHVHGYLPQERLAEALADICFAVVPIPPHNFFQYSDPLKLAEALALGMPVLASDIEPTRDVIAHNRGVVCAHDEEEYSAAFTALAELSDEDVAAMSGACLSGAHAVSRDAVFSELLGVLGKGT
jgi:glycosyltransferase involved in cell wall biosynthesis